MGRALTVFLVGAFVSVGTLAWGDPIPVVGPGSQPHNSYLGMYLVDFGVADFEREVPSGEWVDALWGWFSVTDEQNDDYQASVSHVLTIEPLSGNGPVRVFTVFEVKDAYRLAPVSENEWGCFPAIRYHTPIPPLAPGRYRVTLEATVEQPFTDGFPNSQYAPGGSDDWSSYRILVVTPREEYPQLDLIDDDLILEALAEAYESCEP